MTRVWQTKLVETNSFLASQSRVSGVVCLQIYFLVCQNIYILLLFIPFHTKYLLKEYQGSGRDLYLNMYCLINQVAI